MGKATADEILFARLEAACAEDILSGSWPAGELDDFLSALGENPEALRSAGDEMAQAMLQEKRDAWKREARAEGERLGHLVSEDDDIDDLDPETLRRRFEALRNDRQLAGHVAGYFRKRGQGPSSDAELREIVRELEMLKRLESSDDESRGS